MLAIGELYVRRDEIKVLIDKTDEKIARLQGERKALAAEHDSINAGITAIGTASGIFK